MRKRTFLFVSILTAFSIAAIQARVERVEILSRGDILDGKLFGDAGAYEKIVGKIHFAVKPDDPHNKLIVDLDKAPRNAAGDVEFASDFYLLRPKEAGRASGSALIEIPNRGGKGILAIMNGGKSSRDPKTEEEFGDGFLMKRGAIVAWLGWQWDVRDEAGLMRLYAPIARGDENPKETGKPITGLARADFIVNEKVEEHPLGHFISGSIGGTEYPCSDPNDLANVLTVRDAPMAKRRQIPRSEWRFVAPESTSGAAPKFRKIQLNG